MTRSRMPWLLAILIGLAALRWLVPPTSAPADEVAQPSMAAVQRLGRTSVNEGVSAISPTSGAATTATTSIRDQESPSGPALAGALADAFAVRVPAPLVASQLPIPIASSVSQFSPPPPPPQAPAPQPPQLDIIGSWDDTQRPGVFISTSSGTRLVREGELIDGQFRIASLTKDYMVIAHITLQNEWRLQIPRGKTN